MGGILGHLTGHARIAIGVRLTSGAVVMALLATCAAAPEGGKAVLAGPETGTVIAERLSAFDVDGQGREVGASDDPLSSDAAPEDPKPSEATEDDRPPDEPAESLEAPAQSAADEDPGADPTDREDVSDQEESTSVEGDAPDLANDTAQAAPGVGAVAPARPTRVVVPGIGVDNPVVPVGLHADNSLVVPDEAHVAGWYSGFSRPGQTGRPAVIAGHNVWGGRIGVFYRLHQLEPGDHIELRGEDDSTVRFEIERIEQHPKDAFPTNRVYDPTDRADLRVITCGGDFDRSRGSHVDNVIVFAVLVD